VASAVDAILPQDGHAVGSKRPISVVLPAHALTAAIAAAKRVLHNSPPWRTSTQ
jgi:hypothetical protein